MASAEFTKQTAAALDAGYALAAGVQVRGEKFGLLFYNRKGPRLYFLSCGSLLSPEYFGSGRSLASWLRDSIQEGCDVKAHRALAQACQRLAEKGVLHAD